MHVVTVPSLLPFVDDRCKLLSVGLVANGDLLAHGLWRQREQQDADKCEKPSPIRSEEHTSELQSRFDLVYLHSFPTRRSSDLIESTHHLRGIGLRTHACRDCSKPSPICR